MCDTLVAVGEATADGTVILAKNSDREPNEAQLLTHAPRAQHAPGDRVRCTYIEIPQAPETYEALLSRPFWMWGAEMGMNECGVAIGNEAVFTREPYVKGPALTGMDLLRLALERAATAQTALETIVALLTEHGQGGNCGLGHKLYYHNAYLIADPAEAWVLETAGRHWAAQRVQGVRSISNGLTIGGEWDLASPGLADYARQKGWLRPGEEFHLARCFGDPFYTRMDGCRPRQARSSQLMREQAERISPASMMAALRDHGPRAASDPSWNPGQGWVMDAPCVHASLGPLRPSQTTASLVAHLAADARTAWATGASAPCTGIFKPVYLGAGGLPETGASPEATYAPQSLWWAHERLHRAVLGDYATRLAVYRAERDALEAEFLRQAVGVDASAEARAAFSASCWRRAAEATARWSEAVLATPVRRRSPFLHRIAWAGFNRQAGMAAEG
jgi:dipeptidase